MRKYNLKRNLLSNKLSPKLKAGPVLLENADKLIDKCVRLQRKKDTCM